MKKIPTVALMFATSALCSQAPAHKGPVDDPEVAIQIGVAALIPVYGKRQIESERPFHAQSDGPDWIVTGSLHCPDGKGGTTDLCFGGVAMVRIAKADGRIVDMFHGK